MAILDLKVWTVTEKINIHRRKFEITRILHELYMKEVSSKLVIHANSSRAMKVKRILF